MTDTMQDLAKRAVASPHWRWMPGMLDTEGKRVACRVAEGTVRWVKDTWVSEWWHPGYELPDLDDPATLGCLLALVTYAHDQPTAYVEIREGRSRVCATYGTEATITIGPRWTIGGEAHALVAALEAAP